MLDTVLFDLDGTLVDTLGDLALAGNRTLAALGLAGHPEEQYRRMVGNGIPKLVERMLPAENRGAATQAVALELFHKNYARHMEDTTAPYPGIEALLAELAGRGCRLGVLTNKQDAYARMLVDRFFPGVFQAVLGHREGAAPKPDPATTGQLLAELGAVAGSSLFVGDSDVDIYTGHRAGMRAAGVTWGFRGRAELVQAGADFVIDTPGALLEILE